MNTDQEDPILQFAKQLVEKKNLTGVDDEVKEQLVKDLAGRLENQINRALMAELSDADLDEFEKLIDQEGVSQEQIQNFFKDKGVNQTEVVARVGAQFQESYLSN